MAPPRSDPRKARADCAPQRRVRARARRRTARQGLPVEPARRVAVVTGASSGIGESVARALTSEGWHVVLVARREERLRALASELDGEYEVCDVSRREDVEHMAASVLGRHPRVDLLVNNAGIPGRAGFARIDPERLEQVLRTNYLGSVWCLRSFLPGLEAAAPHAHVVNIASIAGTVAFAEGGPYCASKHAQVAFSRATAAELGPRGIHVHTVNPGFVETEGFPQAATLRSAVIKRLVVGPDHIAGHVLKTIARDRRETFVPRWYRIAPIAQALVPSLFARAAGRSGFRRR